ncbi:MAG TPA: PA14 domain-containing protein, partial [bacterium]|nr:PA14 domain-containing protein [bacterium]
PPLSVLFVVLCFFFLLRGLRGRRCTDFLLCGAMAGFGIMTYAPTRLLVVMLVVLFLHQCLSRKKFFRTFWYAPLLIMLGGQLTSCPINVAAFTDSAMFTARMKQTTVFKAGKPREQAWKDVRMSTGKHLLMFNYKGDPNARHGIALSPKLDPLTAAFFALGILVCVFRWRHWESALLAFWLLIGLLAGILTLEWEAPQSCRTQLVIPAAMLLAGVPFSIFWHQLKGLWGRWRWIPFFAAVLPLLVWLTIWNYRYYFVRTQADQNVYEEFVGRDTSIARYLATQDLDENFFVHQQSPNDYPAIPFLLNRRDIPGVLYQMPDYIPMRMQTGKKLHYLLEPYRTPFPEELFKHYYPGGQYHLFEDPWKKPIFYTYVVSADEVASIIGLSASYRAISDPLGQQGEWKRVERSPFDLLVGDNAPSTFPVRGHWTGSVFIEQSADYLLSWSDGEPICIALDNEPLPEEGQPEIPVSLIRGWHNVEIVRTVNSANSPFRLMFKMGAAKAEQFKSEAFCARTMPDLGYYGRYYANLDWAQPASYGIIQPTISIRWHPEPVRGRLHWSGKWSAYLNAEKPGQYGFLIRCNAYCRIEVDGKQVLEQPERHQNPGRANIPLEAGEHVLEIFYKEPGQYSELHVLWAPPGGREEIIPYDKIRPKFD